MLSNVVNIQLMQARRKWDFASYHPNYEKALTVIRNSHWPVRILGELVEFFKYGASIPADYVKDGTLFIRAQNIRSYGIDLSDVKFVDSSAYSLERYTLQAGDILITRSGINVGEAAYITPELAGSAHGSYSIRLRLGNKSISPEYVAFVINSHLVQSQIDALTGRSAQPNINIAELSGLKLVVPPREVQDRIAGIMQAAYAARREKLTEAEGLLKDNDAFVLGKLGIDIATLQRQRTIIKPISQIAGGRFDFEAVAANLGVNFNGLTPTSLGAVVEQITVRILPPEDCPDEYVNYISLGHIASNTGELVDFAPVKGAEVLSSSVKFQRGDILFGRMRPYLNKVWIAGFDGICTGEAIVLRPKSEKVDTAFLHTLLLSRIMLMQVVPFQSGTSLPRVSASHILSTKLPIPQSVEEQKKISAEITRRRAEAKRLRAEAEQVVAEAKAKVERMILGEET